MKSSRIFDVPGLNHLWKLDNFYLAGQPSEETFEALKDENIKKVYNLRGESEMDFTWEENKLKEMGIDYEQFPIVTENGLDVNNCQKLNKQVNDNDTFFIHCGSANRVGAWLITYLVLNKGMDFEDAVELASNSGLSNPAFVEQAEQVIEKSKS
ncbi:MAG: hypothetical protein CME64_12835 [Halobacteriovoraceae bacterium]|nr:hypothetical protein [Halobacteriovoraceae bacterium]|tara:strand:- start:125505 stop:125966 length:462 start_codon:yes stop_codon:yes gene_type:complete